MGFFKWIKRELDTPGSCKRRQSEPPISFGVLNSETTRDESYVRAIFKFNEWRSRHRFGSFRNASRRPSKGSINKIMAKREENCVIKSEDVLIHSANSNNFEVHNNGVYEEICVGADNNSRKALQDEVNILRSSCLSSTRGKIPSGHLQYSTARKTELKCRNDNEIYEFENNHCVQHKHITTGHIPSPPKPFYKENSNPFSNVQSPNKDNPGRNPTSKKARQSPITDRKKSTLHNIYQRNKIFLHDDLSNNGHHQHLPDVLSNHERFQDGISSPSYQMIINSKGEEVEYAVPFCEKSFSYSPSTECKQTCQFNDVPDQIRANDKEQEQPSTLHSQSLPNTLSFDFTNRRNVIVTDLDKSEGTTCNSSATSKGEILRELNSLEMWSKNISLEEQQENKSTTFSLNDIMGSSSTIMCHGKETENKDFSLKAASNIPVFINLSNFRKMAVSKFYIRHPDKFVVEKALQHNFLIMRKIRHPCISLLMASTLNVNRKLSSLILEPLKCTLNELIHESNKRITLEDCIDYTIQINKAAIYLQENGLIHSNICSHTICVCEHDKQVKLSSFHLTTFLKNHIKGEILALYSGPLFSKKMNSLSGKYLPYFVEYRKIFSQHFYQPPELITTEKMFVFPCKQTDVYGIVLTLWEMLNSKTPFAMFTYSEMEKIFSLKQAQLPNFEAKRCEKFESVLDHGLRINPNERIKDVNELYTQLLELRKTFRFDSQVKIANNENDANFVERSINANLSPFSEFPHSSGLTTSTAKKRKTHFSNNKALPKELFGNSTERQSNVPPSRQNVFEQEFLDANGEKESVLEVEKGYKRCQFEIGDLSLPDTPIARNNKIRKTVWLTNKSISPISPMNYDCKNFIIHNGNVDVHSQSSSLKKYNVNITIIKNDMNNEMTPSRGQHPSIQSQIKYWNSLTSPSEEDVKSHLEEKSYRGTEKQTNELQKLEVNARKNSSVEDVTFKNTKIATFPDIEGVDKEAKNNRNYYPSMPELLSETFRRKNKKADEEFERVFWKREKEICELSSSPKDKEENGVITPKRTTVKEAVSRFEKISTEVDNNSITKDNYEYDQLENNTSSAKLFTETLEKKMPRKEVKKSEEHITSSQKTGIETQVLRVHPESFKLPSNNFEIRRDESLKISQASSSSILETGSKKWCHIDKKKFNKEIEEETVKNISKLDVLLRYDRNDEKRKTNSNPELNKLLTKEKDVNVNVWRKSGLGSLIRRSSDVGCSPRGVVRTAGHFATFRHSIGGTESRSGQKQIQVFNSAFDFRGPPENNTLLSTLISNNSKLFPKITCQDCGSHNVYISGKIRRQLELSSAHLSKLSVKGMENGRDSFSPASIEDLYIDDDLKHESSELGPHLKLNTTSETSEPSVIKDFDPNILNFSTMSSEYFQSDEALVSNPDLRHK